MQLLLINSSGVIVLITALCYKFIYVLNDGSCADRKMNRFSMKTFISKNVSVMQQHLFVGFMLRLFY